MQHISVIYLFKKNNVLYGVFKIEEMIKIYFSPYIFAHTSLRTVTFLTWLTIKEKIAPFTLVLIFYFKILMDCDSHITFFFFSSIFYKSISKNSIKCGKPTDYHFYCLHKIKICSLNFSKIILLAFSSLEIWNIFWNHKFNMQ